MKLRELPTRDLLRSIRATESSSSPDPYAQKVLREELERRRREAFGVHDDDREPLTREWIDALPRTDVHGWRIGDNPDHTFDLRFRQVFRDGYFVWENKCWLWIWVDSDQSAVQTCEVRDRGHARQIIAALGGCE